MKPTAVIGAHPSTDRYSHIATKMLNDYGHTVWPLGIRTGLIGGLPIITEWPVQLGGLDTITLYLNPQHQQQYFSYFMELRPKRIIFNPGTENPELYAICSANGVEVVEACTLVMLRTNQY